MPLKMSWQVYPMPVVKERRREGLKKMKLFDQKKDVKNITLQMLKQRPLTQRIVGPYCTLGYPDPHREQALAHIKAQ